MKRLGILGLVVVAVTFLGLHVYRTMSLVREPPGITVGEFQSATGSFYWHFKRWPADKDDLISALTVEHRDHFARIERTYDVNYQLEILRDPTYPHKATVIVVKNSPNRSERYEKKLNVTRKWYEGAGMYANYFGESPPNARNRASK